MCKISISILIVIECYEEISAIGKEVETFPATFDFFIAFKSKLFEHYAKFPINSVIMDFHKFLITLHAEFYL